MKDGWHLFNKSIIIWRIKREILILCCFLVYQLCVSVGSSVLTWSLLRNFMQSVHILKQLWTCDHIDIFLDSSGYLNTVPTENESVHYQSFIWAIPYTHPDLTRSLSFTSTMILCIFRNLAYDTFSFFISSYFEGNLCAESYSRTYWHRLKKYVGTWGIPYIVLNFAGAVYFRSLSWKHFMGWSLWRTYGMFAGRLWTYVLVYK